MPQDALSEAEIPLPARRLKGPLLLEALKDRRCGRKMIAWAVLFVAVMAYAIGQAGMHPLFALATLVYGFGWWTLIEYVLHRKAMHLKPEARLARALGAVFLPHENHHERPDSSSTSIFEQPWTAIFYATVIAAVFAPLMPLNFVLVATLGGGLGYLGYEVVHFGAHRCQMSGRLLRTLKRHHLYHHYRDASVNFGVTTRFWDWVFGTLHRVKPA